MRKSSQNAIKMLVFLIQENIPDTTATDFYDYWKMDYEITNRNFGCLISCLAKKWNIHHPDGKIHKDNAADFAKQYGAGKTPI